MKVLAQVSRRALIARPMCAWALLMGGVSIISQPSQAAEPVQQANARDTWYLVQPVPRGALIDPVVRHYVRYLPQYLGEKVVFHDIGKGEYLDGVRKVLASSAMPQTIILMSPSLFGNMSEERIAANLGARLQPLQMVLERSWCLVSPSGLQINNGEDFVNWLKGLNRPVRVGTVSKDGLPSIWLKAIERKTNVTWQISTFPGSTEQTLESLAAGKLDLALELCPEVVRILNAKATPVWRDKVKMLATASDMNSLHGKVPSFSQWRLSTIQPSWIAWFGSASLSASQQTRLAHALYQVTMREDTQALIRDFYQQPSSLTPQESQAYIANWLSNWQSIGAWLKGLPVDTSIKPAPKRSPKPAVAPVP